MAVSRQKKESILKDLNEQFKKAQIVVFVNFHGLSTVATRKLRALMRKSVARYYVAKKTLIKKALEMAATSGIASNLEGEVGIIFGSSEKLTEIAKNIAKFIKEHKELSIVGGVLENRFIGPKMVMELSTIPSREELLAKLIYTINSPSRRLVGALGGNFGKLVNILSQIKKI